MVIICWTVKMSYHDNLLSHLTIGILNPPDKCLFTLSDNINLLPWISADTLPAQSSRLESNLSEILHDETALPHFFQFAEARGYSAILNLWGDLKQLIGLRPVLIDERTCPNQCASENPSPLPLTGKDLCHRYLTEDIIQRYRLPEALCLRVQEAFSKNASYDQECQQLQEFIYHMLKRE